MSGLALCHLYGFRATTSEGWTLAESLLVEDAFRGDLARCGIPVDQLVEIAVEEKYPGRLLSPMPARFTPRAGQNAGWSYDRPAACWRAPLEPLSHFAANAPHVEDIEVSFALPEAGWLPITITAAGQTVEFDASDVYDPLSDLMEWLELLLDGGFPRLLIDIEGAYVIFHTLPAGDRVRFIVECDYAEATAELDIVTDRLTLLASIYQPLMSLWESEAFAERWFDWKFASSELDRREEEGQVSPDEPIHPDPIRSKRIDAALGSWRRL